MNDFDKSKEKNSGGKIQLVESSTDSSCSDWSISDFSEAETSRDRTKEAAFDVDDMILLEEKRRIAYPACSRESVLKKREGQPSNVTKQASSTERDDSAILREAKSKIAYPTSHKSKLEASVGKSMQTSHAQSTRATETTAEDAGRHNSTTAGTAATEAGGQAKGATCQDGPSTDAGAHSQSICTSAALRGQTKLAKLRYLQGHNSSEQNCCEPPATRNSRAELVHRERDGLRGQTKLAKLRDSLGQTGRTGETNTLEPISTVSRNSNTSVASSFGARPQRESRPSWKGELIAGSITLHQDWPTFLFARASVDSYRSKVFASNRVGLPRPHWPLSFIDNINDWEYSVGAFSLY
jgi:hypothetical protein